MSIIYEVKFANEKWEDATLIDDIGDVKSLHDAAMKFARVYGDADDYCRFDDDTVGENDEVMVRKKGSEEFEAHQIIREVEVRWSSLEMTELYSKDGERL